MCCYVYSNKSGRVSISMCYSELKNVGGGVGCHFQKIQWKNELNAAWRLSRFSSLPHVFRGRLRNCIVGEH